MQIIAILIIGLYVAIIKKLISEALDVLSNYGDFKGDKVIGCIICALMILWFVCFLAIFGTVIKIAANFGVTGIPSDKEFLIIGITANIATYSISRFITNIVVKYSLKRGLIKKADTKVNRSISIGYGGRTKKF
ncbi:hypothetical protein MmarC5_1116 [Methanococcus maripaludis C5]|uniref:Uncharacterized protein n=1 Tax=Methanococcus maripaludis (strain C5 / ATCC BAA-1333) TaxID=402880 RepID=A4FYY4_METM5|nr:hypothetical protein [Methanococcus maripaludis]ABO35418.1 hypothetical protein MmarC5_1116 [Methanococcus maripaludis C5]